MYTLYADGSCIGNPGPGGAAWLVLTDGGGIQGSKGSDDAATTNNRMELEATIEGLRALARLVHVEGMKPGPVALKLDSQYVLKGIFEYMDGWKAKGWHKVKNPDLWRILDREITDMRAQGFAFESSWVKGHAEDAHNNLVDEEALKAARQAAFRFQQEGAATPAPTAVATATSSAAPVAAPAAPVAAAPEPAPKASPDEALAAARMLLLVARDPDTTAASFLADIASMRQRLGF